MFEQSYGKLLWFWLCGVLAVVDLNSIQPGKLGAEDVYCWGDFVIEWGW